MIKRVVSMVLVAVLLIAYVPIIQVHAVSLGSITPSKDKFVDNTGGYSSWVTNDQAWLYGGYSSSFGVQKSAICFDVSQLPSGIQSVRLGIPLYYATADALFQLYGSNDDSWSSSDTSLPSADTLIHSDTLAEHTTGSIIWKTIDVTSFVVSEIGGDGLASFLIQGNLGGPDNFFSFMAMENSVEKPYLSYIYANPTVNLSTTGGSLNEENIGSNDLLLTLTDCTFVDANLDPSNFQLSSAIVDLDSVSYISSVQCRISLRSLTDDIDQGFNINIAISGSELSTGSLLTSNTLSVTATNDAESIFVTTDVDGIKLGKESGEVLTIELTGGTFSETLNKNDWTLNNFPSGVTIDSISRTDSTHASIILSGNSTGVSTTISNASVTCGTTEFSVADMPLQSNTFQIELENLNPPVQDTNGLLTVVEGQPGTISNSYLKYTDPENSPSELTYTVTTAPTSGSLELSDNPGVSVTSFTQLDIDNNLVTYIHDGSETIGDGFDFTVDDGKNSAVNEHFTIAITPVNDVPILVNAIDQTLSEGGTIGISQADLKTTDAETDATVLVYDVTQAPANGVLRRSDVSVVQFTQKDIDDGLMTYVHDSSETVADYFDFTVTDGVDQVNGTIRFTILPIDDDAPYGVNNVSITMDEGATWTVTSDKLQYADAEATAADITYTVTNGPANGSLNKMVFSQEEINLGDVRYIHDGSETTVDSISFNVSDNAGNILENQSYQFIINPVNDESPVLVVNTDLEIRYNEYKEIGSIHLHATDQDTVSGNILYHVTTVPAHGYLALKSDVSVSITQFSEQDLVDGSVVYYHSGDDATEDSFEFRLTDGLFNVTGLRFDINIAQNDLPHIKSGVSASISQTLQVNQSYHFSGNTVFEDSNGDVMTCELSVNGNAYTAQAFDFTYTKSTVGNVTLRIKANDGIGSSDDIYMVTLSFIDSQKPTEPITETGQSQENTNEPETPNEPVIIASDSEDLTQYLNGDGPIELKFEETDRMTLVFEPDAFEQYEDNQVELIVNRMDSSTLELSEEEKALIGDLPVYDINLMVNGVKVPYESDQYFEIRIPIDTQTTSHMTVAVYVDDEHEVHILHGIIIGNEMVFHTNHLSFYTMMEMDGTFEDMGTHWSTEAVEALNVRGIVNGVYDGIFAPDRVITRAEYYVMITRFFEWQTDNGTEVLDSTWYDAAVEILNLKGILSQQDMAIERLRQPITRLEMVDVLHEAYEISILEGRMALEEKTVSDSSLEYMTWIEDSRFGANTETLTFALKYSLIKGFNGDLFLNEEASRAEAAQILYNLMRAGY